ncbi:hypothetical protein HY484_03060 [Candidatus Woesearchaeota archaeon]|nr:hypothetical protein [Candidatus Woesearchaeota archaeon]
MIVRNTKGQAPTLIFLIMILLVFYILFLPESEREKLLGENDSTTSFVSSRESVVLLSDDVGTLTQVKEKDIEHALTPVLLEERVSAEVFAELPPFTVRKGWFFAKPKEFVFSLDKPDLTEDSQLSFHVGMHRGLLSIKVNNVEVFDGELSDGPQIVKIKKELLQKVNVVEFAGQGFGLLAREYHFSDVKIVGDVKDVARQSVVESFIVSPEEKNALASGYLSFYAVCNRELAGTLTTTLNGKLLSSAVPNCNSVNRFEFVSDDLVEGKNVLNFNMPSGKARLDSVVVKTKLKPTKGYVNYFNVNSTVYNRILTYGDDVMLRIYFVDDNAVKTADLNINGILSTVDQRNALYEKDITSKTREGNNYVALTPKVAELNVVKLEVKVE